MPQKNICNFNCLSRIYLKAKEIKISPRKKGNDWENLKYGFGFTSPDTIRFSAHAAGTEKVHALQGILLAWSSILNALNAFQEYHVIVSQKYD